VIVIVPCVMVKLLTGTVFVSIREVPCVATSLKQCCYSRSRAGPMISLGLCNFRSRSDYIIRSSLTGFACSL